MPNRIDFAHIQGAILLNFYGSPGPEEDIWVSLGWSQTSGKGMSGTSRPSLGHGRFVRSSPLFWKKGKDTHPQDKIQHLDFTKDPRPLYYKTPPCVFYHKNVRSKAVFGP